MDGSRPALWWKGRDSDSFRSLFDLGAAKVIDLSGKTPYPVQATPTAGEAAFRTRDIDVAIAVDVLSTR